MHLNDQVLFRDTKPCEVVASLTDLSGPDGGVLELSHSVYWAPGSQEVDLDEEGGTAMAYQALFYEAEVDELRMSLNRNRQIRFWPHLMLPDRVRGAVGVTVPGATALRHELTSVPEC